MDLSLYKDLNGWAYHHSAAGDVAKFFAQRSPFIYVVLLAAIFLAAGSRRSVSARRGAVAAVASTGVALLIAKIVANTVDRVRPFLDHPSASHLLVKAAHDPSLPSDHTTGSFAIAVAILLRNRIAGTVAIVIAALVGVSRVMVGAHYPGDALAGAVLGSLVAVVLWLPPFRKLLDAVADWLGGIYDRLLTPLLTPR